MLDSNSNNAWLAGILEGEGSFISKTKLSISVAMTDQDVIERLSTLTGVGRVYALGRQKGHHKDVWRWTIYRRAHLKSITEAVLPWLGKRRTVAAQALLDRIAHDDARGSSEPAA
ncbi:hypothetical protein [Actinoallomurus sp. CA-150999]|uniref:hypothetical protein n=1 Tax=Actinoallomurus sp. CA-150999 TaxID=3239887 RepID=UPI003D92CC29